jgi:protein-tyrosine phosphatase
MHIQDQVDLGLISIYCSALKDTLKYNFPGPIHVDFGLYADYKWETGNRNEYINWPDFSSPLYPRIACLQITDALARAPFQAVEIGCIGGHGRTGTMLACMALQQLDLTPPEAIDFARTQYCYQAVETLGQEKFVEYFWSFINV